MRITSNNLVANAAAARAAYAARSIAGASFTDRLAHAVRPDAARQAAQELVAITFVQPALDHMRNDPFRSELFHGGMGEDVFAGQLHGELAQRIVAGTKLPIVDAVQRQITRQATTNLTA